MKNKRDQYHDRYFKDLLHNIDLARQFLMIYINPAIQEYIDWDTLELYDISLIGNMNKQLYTDLVYKAKTKKERTEVFFIINHERNADNLLPIKSLEYMLGTLKKIIKQKGNPAFIVHITWYNGAKDPYPYAKSILDYFKEKDLAQQMLIHSGEVISTNELDDEILASHEEISIMELFMKYGDSPKLLTWIEEHPDITKKLEENKYLDRSLQYLADVGYHKIEDVIHTFEKVSEKLGQTMLTTAQQIERKTRKIALEEGMREGMQQEKLEIAKTMLKAKEPKEKVSKWTGLDVNLLEHLYEELGL